MKNNTTYLPSKILSDAGEMLRQLTFTRWMSRDLTQAAADFCRNLGVAPCYSEYSPDHLTRYLFWRAPQGAGVEARSGRTKEVFEQIDAVNQEKNWRLLSLHVNENEIYSAVWISSDHFETAKAFLLAHGITPAERRTCDPWAN